MVATTFAADTPLVVTGLVYTQGIAGNWLWWSSLLSGMMTVFLYAKLWRRSGLLTDVEFAEMRYSGKPAAFLRGFRAVYLGLLMNCLIRDDIGQNFSIPANCSGRFIAGRFYGENGRQEAKVIGKSRNWEIGELGNWEIGGTLMVVKTLQFSLLKISFYLGKELLRLRV